ncbi:putative LRR receptor-like serine/threonine-protein kinase [Sesamum alatum]|uniref:LRR receptor-like serine/threonine-protein kinase n=1 Tax=Sesamum alatum TaxID=300844 RepID=A0AAE1YJ35_9LAMI|nr:putative LRR receptor-like serine/threonine-protein kinase [Sesamum alatum]
MAISTSIRVHEFINVKLQTPKTQLIQHEMTKPKSFLQSLIKPFTSSSSKATKNFDPTLKLGEGGFGPVYKGKLDDGREIAVKKLSQGSAQGKKEFQSETKLLARVQHRNVVKLLGYCVHGAEKLLVYQYVANESLDKLLFKSDRREFLDWKRRYDVMTGIAKGLLYLHEEAPCRIIHRDIKASNILLDEKWVPKISDFGMARLYPENETHVNTHVAGTNGYMAPEYLIHGHLSEKADVFSFGVLVLELISGQKNSKFNRDPDSRSLLEWAYKLYKKQRSLEIIDPTLELSADGDQIAMCIHIGLLCVQSDPKSRPDMGRIVVMLSKKHSHIVEEPTRPGYPGSRYRMSRQPTASSSASGTFGVSSSQSFGSSGTSTATTSSVRNPRLDPNGKRPVKE